MDVESGDGQGDGGSWNGGTDLPDDPTFINFNPLGDGFETLLHWTGLDSEADLFSGSVTLADAQSHDKAGTSPNSISHNRSNSTLNGHSSISTSPSVSDLPQPRKTATDDCEAKASAALHSLHWCTMLHTDRPGEPKQTMTRTSASLEGVTDHMPPLDNVLYFNRAAIGTLKELLDCPCVQQPHLALLCMTIASKVLFWYRRAVSSQYQSRPGRRSPNSDHNPTSNCQLSPLGTCSHTTDRVVKIVSFQIGVFDLEDEDRKLLMKGVLLREVRKMESVVDKMKMLGGEYTRDDVCDDELHGSNWYEVAGSKMQAEVQDTLKQIKQFGAGIMRQGT